MVIDVSNFNLHDTVTCGQIFRFREVNDYYATGIEYCDKERVYLFDTYLERHLFHKLYDEVIVSPNENE